jgi:8-amino-3,8-dideoxy-alpha-D-manno-octulosonate transaminase
MDGDILAMADKLAIDGGTPVRSEPMPPANPGETMIGDEERAQVLEVLDARSPFRFYGPNVRNKADQFEAEFTEFVGVNHALGVTSGTAALKVAMLAAGVGPGDEVIVPSVTFIASAGSVAMCHARPVFCEIGSDMGIDPEDFERRITERTRAVMPVHILGGAADMDPIMEVANKHGITVIEDCAQSTGAQSRGHRIGTFGQINAFSLQFQKVITAGEGGVVTTNDDALLDRARRCHDHGLNRWDAGEPEDAFCSEVYRMSDMAGAFALAQIRKLDDCLGRMRAGNERIREAVADLDGLELRSLVDHAGATGQTVMFYTPTVELTDRWLAALSAEGVGGFKLYGGQLVLENPQIMNQRMPSEHGPFDSPLYPEPIVYRREDYPQSTDLLGRSVWLMVSPLSTEADIDDIITAVRKVHAALMG